MAAPTYTSSGQERQLFVKAKGDGSDVNSKTIYSYQNFLSIEDFEKSLKIHLILGSAAPGTDYTAAPLGSLYINTAAGALYTKIASEGAVGDWALVTAVAVV